MATYHFRLKHGSRTAGRSAKGHALYLLREGQYQYRAHELVYVEHGNLPDWAKAQPLTFWQSADRHERSNGRLYTEFEVALPRELTKEERFRLVQDFVLETLRDRHPYTLVIHESQALDGKLQPHFHLMFSVRELDGITRAQEQFFRRANPQQPGLGGATKALDWYQRERLLKLRLQWEQAANLALERAGQEISIDRRTLQEQGILRPPEPVLGCYYSMLLKQGVITERAKQVLELREQRRFEQTHNQQILRGVQAYQQLSDEYRTLTVAKDALMRWDIRLGNLMATLEHDLTYKTPQSYTAALQMATAQLWGRARLGFEEQIAAAKEQLKETNLSLWQRMNPQRFFHRQELKRQLREVTQRYQEFQQLVSTPERLQERDNLAFQLWQQGQKSKEHHQQYLNERKQTAEQLQSLRSRVEETFDRLAETLEQLQALGVRFNRELNPMISQAVGQQELDQVPNQRQEQGFSR